MRKLDRTSTCTVGICNGAVLFAAAGLLKGRKATTNWDASRGTGCDPAGRGALESSGGIAQLRARRSKA